MHAKSHIAHLVELLRGRDILVGLDDVQNLVRLFACWDAEDPAGLRNAVAALLARSGEEAELIRTVFDEYCREVAEGLIGPQAPPGLKEEDPKPPVDINTKVRSGSWRAARVGFLVLGVAAVALVIWLLWPQRRCRPGGDPSYCPPADLAAVDLSVRDQQIAKEDIPDLVQEETPRPPDLLPVPEKEKETPPPAPIFHPWRLLLLLSLVLLAGLGISGLVQRQREYLALRRRRQDALDALVGPRLYGLKLDPPPPLLSREDADALATVLGRIRAEAPGRVQIDVRGSLRRVMRRLWPPIVFAPQRVRHPIVILREHSPYVQAYWPRMVGLLAELHRRGIQTACYLFDGDVVWADGDSEGEVYSLATLRAAHESSAVLVLGSWRGVHTAYGVSRWVNELARWSRTAWLHPLADPAAVSSEVHGLPRRVWPLSFVGLMAAAQDLAYEGGNHVGSVSGPSQAMRPVTQQDLAQLEALLSHFPHPTVELLDHLRRRYCPEVSSDVLYHLVARGEDLRSAGLKLHAQDSPADRTVLRHLLDLLDRSEPVRGSAAHLRWRRDRALVALRLPAAYRTEHEEAQRALRELAEGELHVEVMEWVREPPAGQPQLPQELARSLRHTERRSLAMSWGWLRPGWKGLVSTGIAAVVIVALAWSLGGFHSQPTSAPSVRAGVGDGGSPPARSDEAKPSAPADLYVLAVGINQYKDPRLPRLRLSVPDAKAVAQAFERQAAASYRKVKTHLLLDADATRQAVLMALSVQVRDVTENDVALVYLAGAGDSENGSDYVFVPSDWNPDQGLSSGVTGNELIGWMRKIRGRSILILDSPAPPETTMDRFLNEWTKAGGDRAALFLAARPGQPVSESIGQQHGAFTQAFLEAFGAPPALPRSEPARLIFDALQQNKTLKLRELDLYLSARIPELTQNRQAPSIWIAAGMRDLPLGQVLPTATPAPSATPLLAPLPVRMIKVPPGVHLLARTQTKITFGAFFLDESEVTVDAYLACVSLGKCTAPPAQPWCNYERAADRGRHPINCVTFAQAQEYCRSVGKRLPSEAEWEYAAGGPSRLAYPWGNEPGPNNDLACWYRAPAEGTCEVGTHPKGASPFKLQDMAGNVWEWARYSGPSASLGAVRASGGLLKGGSWGNTPTNLAAFKPTSYESVQLTTVDPKYGFRCASGKEESLPAAQGTPNPDGDKDGVPDKEDVCPGTPKGRTPDPDRKGCPLPDRDSGAVRDRATH